MENTWRLNIRTGWIVGLALAVILIGATVGLVVAAVVTPVSIRVFLLGLGACITLGLAIRVLTQLWGLINANYELDRNALVIHWGPIEHQIPMGSIRDVISGAKLENVRIRPSLRWPGYVVAFGKATAPEGDSEPDETESADLDPILFYASAPLKHQIILRTDGITYAISPEDTEAFLVALRERLEMGPTQEVEEHSTHPAFLDWEIWRDRWSLAMLGCSVGLLILSCSPAEERTSSTSRWWAQPLRSPTVVSGSSSTGANVRSPTSCGAASWRFWAAFGLPLSQSCSGNRPHGCPDRLHPHYWDPRACGLVPSVRQAAGRAD